MASASKPRSTTRGATRCPPQSEARSHKAPARWATRIIPCFLVCVILFACWALTKAICIDFFLAKHEYRTATAFLVLHYIFLVCMLICYARTIYMVNFDPGVVPLEPKLGLETFYTRDFYTCRSDGLPIWCSECQNWKPERAHHSGEIQRCVRKMDHYCPWAGGMIAETSFKFFIQFCSYTSLYCAVCMSAGAYMTNRQIKTGTGLSGPAIVLIGVASFFGLFAFTMASLSLRFACINVTNIENLRGRDKVYQLAIRIPLHEASLSNASAPARDYETITFPLADPSFDGNRFIYSSDGTPGSRSGQSPPAAEHKFAIVKTEVGDNPWDTGSTYTNFKSVMGDSGPLDWLLPLKLSPCCAYNCEYPTGPVVEKLRAGLKA
ncbi:DHHC palmitoyltransferase-domain-containing protein [Coniella lustricola]|uniref:Palmitoyltransferase n=1 Tax=Coniella lustricola TaxID=2025994 RepID=A0A2T3ALX6_9PEZI|nr:DHHC palmitoyltransferase-domain-containing protein [Coniella lustricola]